MVRRDEHSNPGEKQFRFFIRLPYVLKTKRGCPTCYSHRFLLSSAFFSSNAFHVAKLCGKAIFKPCHRSLRNSARLDWWSCDRSARDHKKWISRFELKYGQCRGNSVIQIRCNSVSCSELSRRDDIARGEALQSIARRVTQLYVLRFLVSGNR